MADDDQYDMGKLNGTCGLSNQMSLFFSLDTDSEEMEDEIPSDDDPDFFPIGESINHPNQSNNLTTTKPRTSSEQSTTKHSNTLATSTNHPQDSNFEYVGKCRN